jgi:hypothetical protein
MSGTHAYKVPDGLIDVGGRLASRKGIQQFPSSEIELFILPGFLSAKECDRFIRAMQGAWKPSMIADDIGVADYRTSQTCELSPADPLVAMLDERIIALTGLDPLHGEPLQGQRYLVGEEFKEHTDYFEPDGPDFERFCSESGQRTWTVMLYLNEPEAGGITLFKKLGMGVKPATGTLLAWNNMTRFGTPNGATLHHGMPVERGTKFVLTKWFREKPWPWPEAIARQFSTWPRLAKGESGPEDEPPATHPGKEPTATVETDLPIETRLKRRDWILSVQQSLSGLAGRPGQLPRVRGLSAEAFLRDHYAAARPVIIEGELDDWPALGLWNPDYLKRKVGPAPVEFQGQRDVNPSFELQKDVHRRKLPFDSYIDLIAGKPGNHAYITAYNSGGNGAALTPLQEDVRPLSKFLSGQAGMPWIGPLGTFTPLHFDLTNNMIVQVVGSKRFIMVPPSESRLLYNHRHVFSAVHDIADEAALDRYPLAREAMTYEFDLEAGELLFIPIGWWHQVTALDFSVSFTHTDFHWNNDFHTTFPPD